MKLVMLEFHTPSKKSFSYRPWSLIGYRLEVPHLDYPEPSSHHCQPRLKVSDNIFKAFMETNKSGTSAILMATHDYHLIQNYPKRVLKCGGGGIQDSTTEELEISKSR